jgi:hypothetical protein
MHGPISALTSMKGEIDTTPTLTSISAREPNERPFTICRWQATSYGFWTSIRPSRWQAHGHASHADAGYVVLIEGELVLILDDTRRLNVGM